VGGVERSGFFPGSGKSQFLTALWVSHVGRMSSTYLLVKGRPAQDSQMMANCLVDSLTKEAKAKMFMEADKYTISGYPDGECFLKVLIGKAQVKTIATVNMLWSMINKPR
jgi:hypothetical protein